MKLCKVIILLAISVETMGFDLGQIFNTIKNATETIINGSAFKNSSVLEGTLKGVYNSLVNVRVLTKEYFANTFVGGLALGPALEVILNATMRNQIQVEAAGTLPEEKDVFRKLVEEFKKRAEKMGENVRY